MIGTIFAEDVESASYVSILKRLRRRLCLMDSDIVHENRPSVAGLHYDVLRISLAPVDSTVVVIKVFQCLLRLCLCENVELQPDKR